MDFFRFFYREISFSKGLLFFFVLCTALSLVSVTGLGAFDASVKDSLDSDAKEIAGGDILISSQNPLSENLLNSIAELNGEGIISSQWLRFSSVAVHEQSDESALVQVQVVDEAYPLYGSVILEDGNFTDVFAPGSVLVEKNLMERLSLERNDLLKIGEASFVVSGVLDTLPTGSFSLFSSGQTVLMKEKDVAKTELLGARSRVSYQTALAGFDEASLSEAIEKLKNEAAPRENVESYISSETSQQRFLEEFLFFLNIMSIFTLLLAGFGIMTSLNAYIRKRQQSIAVFKVIGMTDNQLLSLFLGLIFTLALLGMILGTLGGIGMMKYLPQFFASFLPEGFVASLQWGSFLQVVLIAFVMSLIFTLTPLLRLRNIKPVAVFRKDPSSNQISQWTNFFVMLLISSLFSLFIIIEVGNIRFASYLILGIIGLIGIAYMSSKIVLKGLRWLSNRQSFLLVRLSLKGLLRQGGKMALIMTSITTAFAVLMSISLLENNILYQFVNTYPEGFPNVFMLDIQKNQQEDIAALLPPETQFFPVIRATLQSKNAEPVIDEEGSDEEGFGDRLGRSFNLTYDVPLSDNEVIVSSQQTNQLFQSEFRKEGIVQVSLLEEFQRLLGVDLGDSLIFSIQGVEIQAEVSSIRKRVENRFEPFFYFVFEGKALESAPQTLFATSFLNPEEIPSLQNSIAKVFPNVATIDTSEIINRTADLLQQLTMIIRFFGLFSLTAGLILLLTALLSTSLERIQEVVYYKLLGFRGHEVARIALMEFSFLGFFAATLGTIGSQIAVYLICDVILDLSFKPFVYEMLIMNLVLIAVVILIASFFLIPLLKTKPVNYLRDNLIE